MLERWRNFGGGRRRDINSGKRRMVNYGRKKGLGMKRNCHDLKERTENNKRQDLGGGKGRNGNDKTERGNFGRMKRESYDERKGEKKKFGESSRQKKGVLRNEAFNLVGLLPARADRHHHEAMLTITIDEGPSTVSWKNSVGNKKRNTRRKRSTTTKLQPPTPTPTYLSSKASPPPQPEKPQSPDNFLAAEEAKRKAHIQRMEQRAEADEAENTSVSCAGLPSLTLSYSFFAICSWGCHIRLFGTPCFNTTTS